MIFRDANGKLVEIKRYAYTTDVEYFRKLISLKQAEDNLYQKMQNASQHMNTPEFDSTSANHSNPK
jgi:flagellum-specific peptidoglycan hydrolase FlgJ